MTKICLRLKHQIEQVIPYELEEEKVVKANSPIITQAVLDTANKAGGDGDKTACVVYCLLIVKKWFKVCGTSIRSSEEYADNIRNKQLPSCGTPTSSMYAPSLPK